ncbi:MAG: branched-chain amino acid ABC transporter permease [Candidatus Methylomirabilales bacterium]
MDLSFLMTQALNALQAGMLLFLLSSGLALIFGMLHVINFAHGAFYMLGAYAGLTGLALTGRFWLAVPLAVLAVALLGALLERTLIRRLYAADPLAQALLTFGLLLVLDEGVKWLWGPQIRSLPTPEALRGAVLLLGVPYPAYRLVVVAVGGVAALGLWFFLERSRLGAILRAGVADRQMVAALGINLGALFAFAFGLGAGLAAFGGVMAGPIASAYPGMGVEVLIKAFIVVVIGGLGSLKGAAVGSLLVGVAETFGQALAPDWAMAVAYAVMAAVLLWRPTGLFGAESAA